LNTPARTARTAIIPITIAIYVNVEPLIIPSIVEVSDEVVLVEVALDCMILLTCSARVSMIYVIPIEIDSLVIVIFPTARLSIFAD
jgi:hypothetical protein